jgi:hypothetical protein
MSNANQARPMSKGEINRVIVDALKSEMDPVMIGVVKDKVIKAAEGNEAARRWLQTTDGSLWLVAVGEYLDDQEPKKN